MVNFPNLLSLGRILLTVPFIFLLSHQQYGWALLIFLTAALSDAIDGLLARLLGQRTILGAYLDPAADKLLMAASFVALTVLGLIPWWLGVIVIGRDILIVLGLAILIWVSHPLKIQPSIASKITTVFQFGTILATLWSCYSQPNPSLMDFMVWATAAATIISGGQYLGKGLHVLKQGKSPFPQPYRD